MRNVQDNDYGPAPVKEYGFMVKVKNIIRIIRWFNFFKRKKR